MAENRCPFALWLVPEKEQQMEFKDQISQLCRRFGATPFPPHMTLFAGACSNPENIGTGFFEWLSQRKPITLTVTGIGNSDEYFKTLTYTLSETAELRALHERIARETDPQSGYVLQPHLSLLYKTLDSALRERLGDEISQPSTICFDAMALVTPGNIHQGWRDISSWRILKNWRFL